MEEKVYSRGRFRIRKSEETEEKNHQRVHKVKIRKGEVIEKSAEFENSAFSLLYSKAKQMILDIIQDQEHNGGNGHLLSFMGERGSGKTTAMLSFLRALEEGSVCGKEAAKNDAKARFISFDVIDASMLEDEEDLFEIILSQMFSSFWENSSRECSFDGSWKGEQGKDRKEIQKMFHDLLERFWSLKGNSEELSSLVSLKNLSYSSKLRQNFQNLVDAYISYGQDAGPGGCNSGYQTYLVFAIDDLDMNIAKGFEMLAQIHRYMLVRHVIIMVTAKYEQLEILGRKYFSRMVERLDRQTEDWKIDYLNRTVKEYLEKMLPSYCRLYLPDFEDRVLGYGDDLVIEKEGRNVKETVLGKIFRRTGVYFDGSGEKRHYLMPASMRGLNDYYIFLNELVKLKQDGENKTEEQTKQQLENLEKFENDFVYRYIVERLAIEERREVHKLLKDSFSQWNIYMLRFSSQNITRQLTAEAYKRNSSILEIIYMDERAGLGNALWGAEWCVEKGWMSREWMDCIITLYSLELNKRLLEHGDLPKSVFGKSAVGAWSNQLIPQIIMFDNITKKANIRYCGNIKGCRAAMDFSWEVNDRPSKDTLLEWLYMYKENILEVEVLSLFFEAFYGSTSKQEKIRFSALVEQGTENRLYANLVIANNRYDFNILGFMTNLLDCETFYDEYQDAFIGSWLDFLEVDEKKKKGKLQDIKKGIRKKKGLSLYQQIKAWNEKARGLMLPYQHTDIYVNLLTELRQWSMTNLRRTFSASNAWNVLREIVIQIEDILCEKDEFLKKAACGQEGSLLEYYRDCPVVQCIKEPEKMGLSINFPMIFGRALKRCCSMNDYDSLYVPENEIDTPEDVNEKDM